MRTALALFFIIAAVLPVFSQQDTTWFDANWQKTTKDKAAFFRPKPVKTGEGFIIADHFADGRVQMKGISIEPDKTMWKGWVTWHYENGNIKQRALYVNNLIDSLITYHSNGRISTIQPQRNGDIDGTAFVYDSIGQLTAIAGYVKGRRHGELKQYFQGNLWRIERYTNGKLNGTAEYFNSKAVITRKENYADGKQEGITEDFYDNGIIKSRTFYVNGKRNGKDEDFDEQGRLKRSAHYIEYDLHGPVTYYHPNGNVQSLAWYKNDLPDSVYTVYEPSGKLQLETQLKEGILHGKYLRYKNGKIITDAAFRQGSLQYWKSFHSNGNPWRHCVVNTDSLTEHWTTYTATGRKVLETVYRFNDPEYHWQMFDEDGLALEITYRPDYTKEAVERRKRWLLRERKEKEAERKRLEGDESKKEEEEEAEENTGSITPEEVAATTLLFESAENVSDHLPAHYSAEESELLDKENVFETFGYQSIRLHYGKSAIIFSREAHEDSSIHVTFNGSIETFSSELNELSFNYITKADGLQLIEDHEAYRVKANELAMFAEPPSELVQRVILFSIGHKLRKKIVLQPLLLGAIASHLYRNNNQGFSLTEFSLALCREVFDKK